MKRILPSDFRRFPLISPTLHKFPNQFVVLRLRPRTRVRDSNSEFLSVHVVPLRTLDLGLEAKLQVVSCESAPYRCHLRAAIAVSPYGTPDSIARCMASYISRITRFVRYSPHFASSLRLTMGKVSMT